MKFPKMIPLRAKVTTRRGDGMVVGILRTKPMKYDVLLPSGKILLYLTEEEDGVRLLDDSAPHKPNDQTSALPADGIDQSQSRLPGTEN